MQNEQKTESFSRTITFTSTNKGSEEKIIMEKTFDGDCTWNEISEMYCRFLQSMGYVLEPSDVGSDF